MVQEVRNPVAEWAHAMLDAPPGDRVQKMARLHVVLTQALRNVPMAPRGDHEVEELAICILREVRRLAGG